VILPVGQKWCGNIFQISQRRCRRASTEDTRPRFSFSSPPSFSLPISLVSHRRFFNLDFPFSNVILSRAFPPMKLPFRRLWPGFIAGRPFFPPHPDLTPRRTSRGPVLAVDASTWVFFYFPFSNGKNFSSNTFHVSPFAANGLVEKLMVSILPRGSRTSGRVFGSAHHFLFPLSAKPLSSRGFAAFMNLCHFFFFFPFCQ